MKSSSDWMKAFALLLCTLQLASCKSLPVIDENSRTHHAKVARIQGSHGQLSAERSQAIVDQLRNTGHGTFFDIHLAVEESVTGSPLTSGNAVTLLHDGPETYDAMLRAIDKARSTINMETYIFEDDETGRRFADALIRKQQQGVKVNVIHDSVGTLTTPAEFFTRLTDAGINVLEFNPVNPLTSRAAWSVNQRDHRKLLIIDGATAFLGGINISGVYTRSRFSGRARREVKPGEKVVPWRDTDVELHGPVVNELQKLYLQTWTAQRGEAPQSDNWFPTVSTSGKAVVRAIGSSPEDPYSYIYATLVSAFRSAQQEIWIANAYFVPDPQLVQVLKDAAARGVDVRLLLPSVSDSWMVKQASHAHYAELLKAGVKLYQRRNALLHSKTAVVDGVWSTIGSSNLDWRSFLHNQEVNVVVLGDDFGQQMRKAFEEDLAESDALTLDHWRQRALGPRLGEMLGRLWEYWL